MSRVPATLIEERRQKPCKGGIWKNKELDWIYSMREHLKDKNEDIAKANSNSKRIN